MLRVIAVLAIALLSVGNHASAHEIAYPPYAEACDRYPGETWQVSTDDVVETYLGCFIEEGVDASGDISCPDGTFAEGNMCYPIVEEDLNDGWYDDEGNLIPSQGECPEGYFVWPSPDNGLDHDICSEKPEELSGPTDNGDDKGIYPVIGPAFVVGTDDEGVVCREAPDGAPVITLPEGTLVTELEDGVADGWQMVAYQESETVFPSCFIWSDYLSDAPPASELEPVAESTETEVTITQGPVNGPDDTDEVVEVTKLPSTGSGTAASEGVLISWLLCAASLAFLVWLKLQLSQLRTASSRLRH